MVAVDLKSVVGRLSDVGRRQLEAAAGLTLSRSHYNVEIEHVLLKLVETPGSDVAAILRKREVDAGRVAAELTRALDRLRTGNARAPSLSPDIVTWLREAWLIASLEANATRIRSGHLLAALLSTAVPTHLAPPDVQRADGEDGGHKRKKKQGDDKEEECRPRVRFDVLSR